MARVIRWKFKEYLEQHNLTAYQVEKALQGKASRNLPYVWARAAKAPVRLHTEVLAEVIGALEELTGRPVSVCDLLEYER